MKISFKCSCGAEATWEATENETDTSAAAIADVVLSAEKWQKTHVKCHRMANPSTPPMDLLSPKRGK